MPTTTTTTRSSQMQHVTRTIRSHLSLGNEYTGNGKIACGVVSQQGLKGKSKSKLEGHLDTTYHTTTPHSRQAYQLTIK